MVFIFLEGQIGSGKTTLLKKLEENYGDLIEVRYEPVNEWIKYTNKEGRNILECFYGDIEKYCFAFQMMAFKTKYELMEKEETKSITIFERSLLTDINCFGKNLHKAGLYDEIEWRIHREWYDLIMRITKMKDCKYVYLKTDVDTCMERIKKRGRKGEEGIDKDYLKDLGEAHDQWLNENNSLLLDGSIEFETDDKLIKEYCEKIIAYTN